MPEPISLSETFHTAFYDAEEGKLGLWQPNPLTDPAVAALARKLHGDVNSSLEEQRSRIVRPAPAPQLYFDFFKYRKPIAEATERNEIFLIGAADALLTSLSSLIEGLLSRPQVLAFLSIEAKGNDVDRKDAQDMLFDLVFLFVTNHEIGHFVHGHTGSQPEEWLEFKSDPVKRLPQQAAEIEADGYSTFATLNWLFTKRSPIVEGDTGARQKVEAVLLRLYLLAAFSYLEMGSSRPWRWHCPETFTHPQYLTRVDFIVGHSRGWCERHAIEHERNLSQAHIHEALEGVHNCWHQPDSRNLERQVKDLTSGPYASWEERIREERSRLRQLLEPFQLIVRDYS